MRASVRKIIHCDCDCFYAAVEVRDNPQLRGLPVAVGGSPNSRGVIATCSYEARAYGVRSAMSSAKALQLCPELVFLKSDMAKYRDASRAMHEIFKQYSDCIEPLSLDEAYLDVTDVSKCSGSATLMAKEIRARVNQQLGITISAGVAPNKFLAKVASDWNKPDGLFVIRPEEVANFVIGLDVSKINGVGRVTKSKLNQMGINTCGDLQKLSETELVRSFGQYGKRLFSVARGIDNRPVQVDRVRKSVSVERTYSNDLKSLAAVIECLPALLQELRGRCKQKLREGKTVIKRFVKVKFFDFTQTTLEHKLDSTCEEWDSDDIYGELLKAAWAREGKSVRLLGVGVRLGENDPVESRQLSLL